MSSKALFFPTAPKGCLQYFHKPTGQIESLNYGLNYFGNVRYAICFDKKQNNNALLEYDDENPSKTINK